MVGEGSWTWHGTDCSDREGERNQEEVSRNKAGLDQDQTPLKHAHQSNSRERTFYTTCWSMQEAQDGISSVWWEGAALCLLPSCQVQSPSPLPSFSGLRQDFAGTTDTALHHRSWPPQIKYIALLAPKSRLHAPPCRLMEHHGRAVHARTKLGPQTLQHQDERKCSAMLVLRSAR